MRKVTRMFAILLSICAGALAQDARQYDFTSIDVPGAVETRARGLNDKGDVVGNYTDADGVLHGFLLHDGQFTRIDVPEALDTSALGISDSHQIVGDFDDSAGTGHG